MDREVIRFEPPRLLADDLPGGDNGVVTYELEPDGERTRLVLTHSGITSPTGVPGFRQRLDVAPGGAGGRSWRGVGCRISGRCMRGRGRRCGGHWGSSPLDHTADALRSSRRRLWREGGLSFRSSLAKLGRGTAQRSCVVEGFSVSATDDAYKLARGAAEKDVAAGGASLAAASHRIAADSRQHPMGRYVLDSYCPSAKLVIEVDGFAHDTGDRGERDVARDRWLEGQGLTILRIAATDVLRDPEQCADGILRLCAAPTPPPQR